MMETGSSQGKGETRMSMSAARKRLGSVWDQVAESGVPLVLEKRGNPIAAVISLEDYRLLQEWKTAANVVESNQPAHRSESASSDNLD
jgi:prevent-host-death family protein